MRKRNLAKAKVLVTGAGGFIGSHLCEAALSHGAQVRAFVHYNSRNDWGMLEDLDSGAIAGDRGYRRRPPGSRRRPPCRPGLPCCFSPGRPDWHPLFLCQSRRCCGDQCPRYVARSAGRARGGSPAAGADLDQRGVRHGTVRADGRRASAAPAVTLCSIQSGLRQAGGELLANVRAARGYCPPF